MSDRKQSLQDLLAKVEVGSGIEYSAYKNAFPHPTELEHEYGKSRDKARNAFLGSLDAAKALHEAVLPEFEYGYDGSIAWVKLPGLRTSYRHDSRGGYTARAWLCVIIKALLAQEPSND